MELRALVIDDSRVMRNMVMQNLRRASLADFEFVEAEDGVDGLNKFNSNDIDIIFVDWNMPNMSGIDFVRKVRSMDNTEHVAIVMVTSEKTMSKIEEALDEAGANAYICKPFTAEELQKKLEKVIDGIQEKQEKPSGFFSRLFG